MGPAGGPATTLDGGERLGGAPALDLAGPRLVAGQLRGPHRRIADEHRITGRILMLDPPRLLKYTWLEGENESELRIELTPVDERVRLVLTHSRLANRDEMVGVSGGWHAHLDILDARLKGEKPDGFWRMYNRLEPEYDARIDE